MDLNDTSFWTNDTPSEVCSEDTPVFCVARTVAISLVLGILAVVTVVGNIFVMVAYASDPRIRSSVANLFILNLSIADFIVGAFSIPLFSVRLVLDRWLLGQLPCQFLLMLDYAATNVAVITILFISLDRYWLVTKKLAYRSFMTHRRAATMSAVNWAVQALLYALIAFAWAPLAGVKNVDYDDECQLEPYISLPFVAAQIFLEFLVPLVIIVILNAKVYIKIKRRAKGMFRKPERSPGVSPGPSGTRAGDGENTVKRPSCVEYSKNDSPRPNLPSPNAAYSNLGFGEELTDITLHIDTVRPLSTRQTEEIDGRAGLDHEINPKDVPMSQQATQKIRDQRATSREFNRHRKAAVTLSVLVGVFIAMWLPFYAVSLLASFCQDCVSGPLWEVVNYLLWCNSTINPFLYALLNVRFRQNFLRFLGLAKRCRKGP